MIILTGTQAVKPSNPCSPRLAARSTFRKHLALISSARLALLEHVKPLMMPSEQSGRRLIKWYVYSEFGHVYTILTELSGKRTTRADVIMATRIMATHINRHHHMDRLLRLHKLRKPLPPLQVALLLTRTPFMAATRTT